MATFTKGGVKRLKNNDWVTNTELRRSKSSVIMSMKLMKTGQLTENSAIFDNFNETGVTVHLSLIFKEKSPIDFNVLCWYNASNNTKKEKISSLLQSLAFDPVFLMKFVKSQSGTKMVRTITSDIVKGENSNLIGYLFNIEYIRP